MTDSVYKYEKKLVAFVDILGFREKTNLTDSDAKKPVHTMLANIKKYIKMHETTSIINIPDSHYYVFSDSSMFSAKKEDFDKLIYVIAQLQFFAATNGFFLRGGLTYDYIYDQKEYFYGRGMNRAYKMESEEAKFPRIIIDDKTEIQEYIRNNDFVVEDYGDISDEDGKYYIDFLRKIPENSVKIKFPVQYDSYDYKNIRNYISKELEDSKELQDNIVKDNVKKKYEWLAEYFNAFIYNEGIDCAKVDI